MTVAAVSPLSSLMPPASDTSTQTATAPDSTRDFAAMLSGSSHMAARPAASARGADASETRDDSGKAKDRKQGSARPQPASADTTDNAATLALVGIAVPQADGAAPAPVVDEASTKTVASAQADVVVATTDDKTDTASADEMDVETGVDADKAVAGLPKGLLDAVMAAQDATKGDMSGVGKTALLTSPAGARSTASSTTAAPTPILPKTTVDMLAARGVAQHGIADARAGIAAARKTASDRKGTDVSVGAPADAAVAGGASDIATPAATLATVTATDASTPVPTDIAGQSLAAAGADRQVDLAKSNAWLDGLARDISATADDKGTLRFQVAPERLGTVHVEMTRGDEGSSVRLTASNEASRAILDDARPQLIVEAKAQGIHIASAQVDVGSQTNSDGNRDQGSNQQQPSQMASGQGGSAQSNGGQGGNQPRSQQNIPDYRLRNHWSGTTTSDDAQASATTASDGRYA